MVDAKIHVLGYDEVVRVFGLLGIEGTVVEHKDDFLRIFQNIIKRRSIVMIIINMELPDDIIDYLIDFKTNNRTPFLYLLPDIFNSEIRNHGKIFDIIHELIEDII
ncbi:MAG: V-type ATP synthase subunit F [Promethearchaeota archaeon]